MRISDWSSDVCSSDLRPRPYPVNALLGIGRENGATGFATKGCAPAMSGLVAAERRLVLRVEEYWDNLRRDRAFPRTADIDPVELGEDWCDCFVMNPCQPPEDAIFLFIGPRLLENARLPEDWARSAERRVRDCPQGSMLGRSVQYLGQVLGQRVPVAVSEVFDDAGEAVGSEEHTS